MHIVASHAVNVVVVVVVVKVMENYLTRDIPFEWKLLCFMKNIPRKFIVKVYNALNPLKL
jgi:hypothetical protein